jgi:hypothetical protein
MLDSFKTYSTQYLDMSLTAVTPYNQSNNNIFDPRQITGLALWLDAADSSTVVTSGSNVTAWNDKSGNGKNMISNASFQRPIYSRNSLNGNNSILFFRNASNSFSILENTSFSFVTGSWTYLTVLRRNAANTTFQRFLSMASVINGADNNNSFSVNLNSTSLNNSFNMERSGGSLAATFNTSNVCLLENIVNGSLTNIDTFNANTNYLFANGSSLTSGAGLSVGATLSIAHIRYGCTTSRSGTNDAGFESLQGNIGEVLLFNRTLRRSEIQQVEGYLAWKWGIQRSLPVTHPYYNNVYLPNSYPISYYPTRLTPTTVIPSEFTLPITIRQYIWQPTGMALWLDAADTATVITSGSNVTAWNDKSGNGRNFTTSSGTPQYLNNSVFFNGTTLDIMSTSVTVPYTAGSTAIFVVVRVTALNNSFDYILVFGNNTIDRSLRYNIGATFNGNDAFNTQTWYLNGTQGGTSIPTSIFNNNTILNGTINFTGNTVLQLSSSFNGRYLTGFIQEVLIYSSITSLERQQIEGYLAWKWGLQTSLPTSHPFRLFPP